MGLLCLYLGMVVVGYPIGAYFRKKNMEFKGIGKIEMVTIAFLVFMMGARIGANDEVVRSLHTIGLEAFALVVLAFIGSVFCSSVLRRLLGYDKFGQKGGGAK
ncbi:MAG: LysO family transporter [Firmicutes bacterium]|nr:LysO family transporter [Bacillota bacterium]